MSDVLTDGVEICLHRPKQVFPLQAPDNLIGKRDVRDVSRKLNCNEKRVPALATHFKGPICHGPDVSVFKTVHADVLRFSRLRYFRTVLKRDCFRK